jgi:WD40 repeat protein
LSVERSAAADAANPWPGLAPFTEAQSGLFHGRDAEIKALARRIQGDPLTVLFGQSGLGKSSLLQAGVFPRLRSADFCPVYIRLDHSPGAPPLTEQVIAMVQSETTRAGAWTKPGAAGPSLWEFFHHRDNRLVSPGGIALSPVLVFDQFEELFTLGGAGGAERQRAVAFMSELAELVENRPPESLVARVEQSPAELDALDFGATDYRVVITLREDFLPHLESLKTTMPTLMDNRMRLTRMNGGQALEAVLKPGAGIVTEDVARAIVEFVAGARGGSTERLAELDIEPPLLSVICRELNERRKALGHAQITADLVTGNRREILTDFYDRSIADLPDGMRTFVEDKLLTKSGFRDNLALETALEEPGVTRPLIDTLVNRRLLHLEDRMGLQRVELTHDVLAEVIRGSRDAHHQRLVSAAADRRARRQRWVIAGLAAAILLLGFGSFMGMRSQRLSADRERRLASQRASHTDVILASRLISEGKTTDGLTYLVRAARRDPENPVLAPRLLSVLLNGNFLLPTEAPLALPSPTLRQQWSADGQTLFVQGEDGVIRALDIAGWRLRRTFTFDQKVVPNGWSLAEKNPRVLAVSLEDGSLQVCDAMTGEPRMPPFRPREGARGMRLLPTLSPDGKWVVAGHDEKVWLWDAETGEQRAVFPTYVGVALFSPDSGRLVTHLRVPTGSQEGRGGGHRPQLWTVPAGTPIGKPLGSFPSSFSQMRFSPDGRILVVTYRQQAAFYDCQSGALTREPLPIGPRAHIHGFTPDGSRFVVSDDREVRVFDVAKGAVIFPPLVHGGPIIDVEVRRDGRVLFTNSADGMARLWDSQTGTPLAEPTLQQAQYTPATLSPEGTQVIVLSPQGPVYGLRVGGGAAAPMTLPTLTDEIRFEFLRDTSHHLLRMFSDRAVAVDVASGLEVSGGMAYPQPLSSNRGYPPIWLTPDQRTVLARLEGNVWQVWDRISSGTSTRNIVLERFEAVPAGTHVSNRFVAFSGTWMAIRQAGVWDLVTGKRVADLQHEAGIYGGDMQGAQLSADGRRIGYKTQDTAVHVCDFPSAKELFALRFSGRSEIYSWRFSPDGSRIVTADLWGGLSFSDAADGRLIRFVQRHRAQATAINFSPDGRRVISRSDDGTAQVWDVATGAEVGALLVHNGAVASGAFSPDGKRVATGTIRGEVRIWDTATGQPLTEPMHPDSAGSLWRIQFSPDGRFFVTARGTGRHVWAMPPDGGGAPPPEWLLHLATITAGKRLTDDGEWVEAREELRNVAKVRAEVAALPDSAPYGKWIRWFLSNSPDRPIAPGFTITPAKATALAEQNRFAAMWTRSSELLSEGNASEAEPLLRQLLEYEIAVGGERSAAVTPARIGLAEALVALGRFEEAETLARAGLAARENTQDAGDFPIEVARGVLGRALVGLKRYAEAEPMLVQAATRMRELGGQGSISVTQRRRTRNAAAALAELYETTGRPEKAAEWKKFLADTTPAPPPAPGQPR